jgi:hypothetical protein
MSFNGTEGSIIPIATAAAMTAKSRKTNPTANKGVFFGKNLIHYLHRVQPWGFDSTLQKTHQEQELWSWLLQMLIKMI